MDLELLKERDTPLLSRKRYTYYMTFQGPTPTRLQIRDAVAKKAGSKPELTIIKHVYNRYGIEKAKVIAHVYSKKEDLDRYEEKVLIEKHAAKKEEKTEEPAAPAPAEAAPEPVPAEEAKPEKKEETKEEAPAEEKKEE